MPSIGCIVVGLQLFVVTTNILYPLLFAFGFVLYVSVGFVSANSNGKAEQGDHKSFPWFGMLHTRKI